MENSGGNHFAFSGRERQVKQSYEQLKANNPRVFNWLSTIQHSGLLLSETGYKNVAARFGMSVVELKQVIETFEKGGTSE